MRQTRFPVLAGALAALAFASSAVGQQRVALTKPDAESKESFTRVSAIRELPSGKVLVVDQQDKMVQLVFSDFPVAGRCCSTSPAAVS